MTITALMKHRYKNLEKQQRMCEILEIYVRKFFKSLSNLNPVFLKEIFYFKESNRPVNEKYKLNLKIPKVNQVKSGTKNIRSLGPKFGIPCHTTLKHSKILIFSKRLLKTGME